MPIAICPRCRSRVITSPENRDVVHECLGDTSRSQEDVIVRGDWSDYTGSGTVPKHAALMGAGLQNTEAGTEAGVLGAVVHSRTERGARRSTTRQRQHLELVEF